MVLRDDAAIQERHHRESRSEHEGARLRASRYMYPTNATGPPNPIVPSLSAYHVSWTSEYDATTAW